MINFESLINININDYGLIMSKIGKYIDLEEIYETDKLLISDALLLGFLNKEKNDLLGIKTKIFDNNIEDVINDILNFPILEQIFYYKKNIYISKKLIENIQKKERKLQIGKSVYLNTLYQGYIIENGYEITNINYKDDNIYDVISSDQLEQLNFIITNINSSSSDFSKILNEWVDIYNLLYDNIDILNSNNYDMNNIDKNKIILSLFINYDETKQFIIINNLDIEIKNNTDNKLIELILNQDKSKFDFLWDKKLIRNPEKFLSIEMIETIPLNELINMKISILIINSNYDNEYKLELIKTLINKINKNPDELFRVEGLYNNIRELLIKNIGSFFGKSIYYGKYDLAISLYNNNLVNKQEIDINEYYYQTVYDAVYELIDFDNDIVINTIQKMQLNTYYINEFKRILNDMKKNNFKPLSEIEFDDSTMFILDDIKNNIISFNCNYEKSNIICENKTLNYGQRNIILIFFKFIIQKNAKKVYNLLKQNKWLLNCYINKYKWYDFVIYINNNQIFDILIEELNNIEDILIKKLIKENKISWLEKIIKKIDFKFVKNHNILEYTLNNNIPVFHYFKNDLFDIDINKDIDITKINNISSYIYLLTNYELSNEIINFLHNKDIIEINDILNEKKLINEDEYYLDLDTEIIERIKLMKKILD